MTILPIDSICAARNWPQYIQHAVAMYGGGKWKQHYVSGRGITVTSGESLPRNSEQQ